MLIQQTLQGLRDLRLNVGRRRRRRQLGPRRGHRMRNTRRRQVRGHVAQIEALKPREQTLDLADPHQTEIHHAPHDKAAAPPDLSLNGC